MIQKNSGRDVLTRLYPEKQVAGFCRTDHRVVFFNQVNALVRHDMRILDFGAGRGKWSDLEQGYKLALTTLRGKCLEVVGTDVDESVLNNVLIDRGVVIDASGRLPFIDNYFDMIISWSVFEHVDEPASVAAELTRVLKPGGWLCACTPGKWSYFAILARIIPNKYHGRIVSKVIKSRRQAHDVFPTIYRLNTLRAVHRYFPSERFFCCSYYHNGPPAYHGNRMWLAQLWRFWMWILPAPFSQQIHIFLRKRENDGFRLVRPD